MMLPPSSVKVLKTAFTNQLLGHNFMELLLAGNLYKFEQILHSMLQELYDTICETFLSALFTTPRFKEKLEAKASSKGLKKLVERPTELQLRTGTKIKIRSLYAKQTPKDYTGSRHLLLLYFGCDKKSGLMYQSISCLLSVICPSFELSKQVMKELGIHAGKERVRNLSLSMADKCMSNRVKVQIGEGESLANKNVIVAIDGGRTRTRVYKGEKRSKRKRKYDTPWREPKMFVITTIDKTGKVNKDHLPIYDSCFGDDEAFDLLSAYLEKLSIEKAQSVQFLADGAPWIWKRARLMLESLGVAKDKIIETLDYYHAIKHLNDIKVYIEKEQQESIFKKLKQALWEGSISKIEHLLKKGIPEVVLDDFTPYQYFWKNRKRIDYQTLKANSRPIGSGVIESGIRRLINLRFKSPSSFWYPENVEKLIYMRGIVLSGRWQTMILNLQKL